MNPLIGILLDCSKALGGGGDLCEWPLKTGSTKSLHHLENSFFEGRNNADNGENSMHGRALGICTIEQLLFINEHF